MVAKRFVTYGFKEWAAATNANRFRSVLTKHMRRATELNGLVAVRALRQTIQSSSGLASNAALTVFIKGSSKPLVDHGDLYQSQTYQVVNDFTVWVGVRRQSDEGFDLARALHDGYQVKVTPAMRGMFMALFQVSQGKLPASELTGRAAELWERRPGGWFPLKPETTVLTTPGRPWVTATFQDGSLKEKTKTNWELAVQAAFRELANKGTSGKKSGASKALASFGRKAAKVERALSGAGRKAARAGKKAGKALSKKGKKVSRAVSKVAKKTQRTIKRTAKNTHRAVKRKVAKVRRSVRKSTKSKGAKKRR
jgi:hypothetical protein